MIKYIRAKSILSSLKSDGYDPFGINYNMNIYRGCQHACIYCDSRSLCYRIDNFKDILIKDNALELLETELRGKRKKGVIGTGSMNDPYMPIEKKEIIARRALEIIYKYRFPVHIITKSYLVIRDYDIIRKISEIYAALSFSITTIDDELSKIIEPGAPGSSKRFEAMKKASESGIYSGMVLTPVLPFLTDSPENIRNLVRKAAKSGAKYILAWMGMTQREGQREYYYKKLDKHFPGIREKYETRFGDKYGCAPYNHAELYRVFDSSCREFGIPQKMEFYKPSESNQISLF